MKIYIHTNLRPRLTKKSLNICEDLYNKISSDTIYTEFIDSIAYISEHYIKSNDKIENILSFCLLYLNNFIPNLNSLITCAIFKSQIDNLITDKNQIITKERFETAKKIRDMLDFLVSTEKNIFEKFNQVNSILLSSIECTKIGIIAFVDFLEEINSYSTYLKNQISDIGKNIFANITHLASLGNCKTQIEDACMEITNNQEYNSILKKNLSRLDNIKKTFLKNFCIELKEDLNLLGVNMQMTSRTKSINSIWKKLDSQKLSHEDLCE